MLNADFGLVIIGRNEGERLRRCLASVADRRERAVYVDSGSTDGSPALARSMGFEVIELDRSAPFTAARGRNAGFARLLERRPGLEFVQFVDGDTELVPGWLDCGVAELRTRPEVAIVCGRLREKDRNSSIYKRLCDMEWDGPVGEIAECGGIAMMRASALREVGGFDPSIAAGEEPELCLRLRQAGHLILRTRDEMGIHDVGDLGFTGWWRRSMRSGRALGQQIFDRKGSSRRPWRQLGSVLTWGMILPCAIAATFPIRPSLAAIPAILYFFQWMRIVSLQSMCKRFRGDAHLYATFVMIAKVSQLLGLVCFYAYVITAAPIAGSRRPGCAELGRRLDASAN